MNDWYTARSPRRINSRDTEIPYLNLEPTEEQFKKIIEQFKKCFVKDTTEEHGVISDRTLESQIKLLGSTCVIYSFNKDQCLEILKVLHTSEMIHQFLEYLEGINQPMIDEIFSIDHLKRHDTEFGSFNDFMRHIHIILHLIQRFPQLNNDLEELIRKKIFPLIKESFPIIREKEIAWRKRCTEMEHEKEGSSYEEAIWNPFPEATISALFSNILNGLSTYPGFQKLSFDFIKEYKDCLTPDIFYIWWKRNQTTEQVINLEKVKEYAISRMKSEIESSLLSSLPSRNRNIPGLEVSIKWDMDQTLLFQETCKEDADCCVEEIRQGYTWHGFSI